MAAIQGYTSVVKILLDHGDDVNTKDNRGWTSLMYAAFYKYPELVKLLIEHEADINAKNNDGETALDLALKEVIFVENTEEKAKIADFLREHGGKEREIERKTILSNLPPPSNIPKPRPSPSISNLPPPSNIPEQRPSPRISQYYAPPPLPLEPESSKSYDYIDYYNYQMDNIENGDNPYTQPPKFSSFPSAQQGGSLNSYGL